MLSRRLATIVAPAAVALLLAACVGAEQSHVAEGGQLASPSASPSAIPSETVPAVDEDPADEPSAPQPVESSEPQESEPQESEPHEAEQLKLEPVGDGDRGEAVREVQMRLDDLGYRPGPVDGVYGRRTADAIAAYQHEAGLDVSGAADEVTVEALLAADHAVDVLQPGDEGDDVRALQEALADGPFDPGTADGVYGTKTVQAVYALEKATGLAVDGIWDGTDVHGLARMQSGDLEAAQDRHDRRWVEVDLSRQLMSVYDAGNADAPMLVSHVSTGNNERWCNETAGCRVASTPTGSFTITRRIEGWRESSLDIGRLYNPLYFRGGIALHGALSVPTHPASHGCVRVPMHIAEYLPDLLPNGTPVEVVS